MNEVLTNQKQYVIKGEAKDNGWIMKNRLMIESYACDEMRKKGFLPIMDLNSDLNVSFNKETETFNYWLRMPAYKTTKAKAQQHMGILASEGLLIGMNSESVSLLEL